MRFNRTSLFALTLLAAATSKAQTTIHSQVIAKAFDPTQLSHDIDYNSAASWDAAGKTLTDTIHADGHPFDSTANFADAWTHFEQPDFGFGQIRSKSYASSGYSHQSPRAYWAETLLQANYHLEIDVPFYTGNVSYRLVLPMHGILTPEQGWYQGLTQGSASTRVTVDGIQAFAGGISVDGYRDYNDPVPYVATGGWIGHVQGIVNHIPWDPDAKGVELASLDSVSLGASPGPMGVQIGYELRTRAYINESYGHYSLTDFSGTGSFEIQAFDDNGDQLTGVRVRPVDAVPEPATWLVLGVGFLILQRRRKR